MHKAKLATCVGAAILISACAPTEPPRAVSPPVPGPAGVISGPAPVPSSSSMARDSAPNYVLVGQNPVPNMPDTNLDSPNDAPYGHW